MQNDKEELGEDRMSQLLQKMDRLTDSEWNELWQEWELGMRKFASSKLCRLPLVRHGCALSTTDILQEAFAKTIKAWKNARHPESRKAFLKYSNFVINTFLVDRVRQLNLKKNHPGTRIDSLVGDVPAEDDQSTKQEHIEWVRHLLNKLAEDDIQLALVTYARFGFDRSEREIARQTGLSRYEVSSLVRKAAKWLGSQAQ